MSISKRIICILLSLALLLTWPGFTPKAEAVAGVDDAALAVGLLFCTWAGVTFATNQGAYNAVSNFLNSSVNGLKTCAEVAAKNLVDGTLTFTKGVRDAFNSILPDINATFKPVPGSSEGTILGSAPIGVPLEVSAYNDNTDLLSSPPPLCPGGSTLFFNTPKGLCTLVARITGNRTLLVDTSDSSICYGLSLSDSPGSTIISVGLCFLSSGVACVYKDFYRNEFCIRVRPLTCYDGFSFSDAVYQCDNEPYSSVDSITFKRSQTINGTQAQNALTTADLPDTAYGDDRDRSIEIGAVTGAIAAGLAGSTVAPGLSPDDLTQALIKAMTGTAVLPTTPPTEATEATEATEPGDVPTIVTPDILSGMFGDLFSKLEALFKQLIELVAAIPGLIQTVIDTLVAGFADVITWFGTIGDTLSQGFADVITWFGTVADTISQGFADAKTWIDAQTAALLATLTAMGAAISTFFTDTFPAWITDVKAWAVALPQTIIDAIVAALAAAFVPAAGYWDAKVVACKEAFPLFNSILGTGKNVGGFLSGLGSRPPVIYIDLGNSASWAIGGRTIFLDLTWYAQYKPTMDNVVSAFLWLLFAWRYLLKIPGILRGANGEIDSIDNSIYWSGRNKK